MGITEIYNKIKDRDVWLNLMKDVKNYIRSCMDYQLRNETINKPASGSLQKIRVGSIGSSIGSLWTY